MMKDIKILLPLSGILFLAVVFCTTVQASESARTFLNGIEHYNKGQYEQAAALFEEVARDGVVNEKLYYNAGNAWFKAGHAGKAMLWYERALKLAPHDPDLVYNHQYVSGLLKDKVEEKPSAVFTVLFFWKDLLGKAAIQWLATVLFLLFWVRTIWVMVRSRRLNAPDWVLLCFALVFCLTAVYDYYDARFNKQAIVIAEEVPVRSGLSESSTQLFVLHSGTRVDVDDERKGYMKIRFSDDKIGWVKIEDVEII
jgi:tetratricopeptide (TPR) repeat protein